MTGSARHLSVLLRHSRRGRTLLAATEPCLYDMISTSSSVSGSSQDQPSSSSQAQWARPGHAHLGQARWYAAESAAAAPAAADAPPIGSARVQKLADDILQLTVLESSQLTEILRKKLGLQKPAYGAMPVFAAGAAAAAPGAAAPAAAKEEKKEEAKPAEKTTFNLKLESFTAEGKIKVIKEIRAMANLGLKEAKELVRHSPTVARAAGPQACLQFTLQQTRAHPHLKRTLTPEKHKDAQGPILTGRV